VAALPWPSFQKSPLAPKAVEVNPKSAPSITASPTRNTVALPNHITAPTVPLSKIHHPSPKGRRNLDETTAPTHYSYTSIKDPGHERIPHLAWMRKLSLQLKV
jgi:hypothetical protein